MRKVTSVLIVIMLLIITGCSNKKIINHNYIYKGENEFWSAEYKVNGKSVFTEEEGKTGYKSNSDKVLIVTYKKNLSDLLSVKHLEISYKSNAGDGKLTDNFDSNNPLNQRTYTIKSSGSGIAIENKDETIEVNINLDGKIQRIELKNAQ